jgi:ATP-binding protein involved in chromosome partitioning
MVQNMSMFVCPNCKHETHIFGTDGAIKEAQRRNLDVLGSIPLSEDICLSADAGKPIVVSDPQGYAAQIYDEIAGKIMEKLGLKVSS